MRQRRIVLYALQFVSDNLFHVRLNPVVVLLYHLFHTILSILVREIGNDWYRLVGFLFPPYLLGVHDNLAMENLLLDPLVERIGYGADEHTLRQRGNLRGRNERIHLRIDRCGLIVAVDRDALPPLQDLSEAFGERFGHFAYDLPGEDIADGVHHYFGLFVPVVAHQLAEILKAQKHGDLVAAGGGDQVVQTLEIDGRQLVDDNRGFEFAFLLTSFTIRELYKPRAAP